MWPVFSEQLDRPQERVAKSHVGNRHRNGTIGRMEWADKRRIFVSRGCITNTTLSLRVKNDADKRTLATTSRISRRLAAIVEENNFHWGISTKPLFNAVATRGAGVGTDGRVRGRYKNGVETVLCRMTNNLNVDTECAYRRTNHLCGRTWT